MGRSFFRPLPESSPEDYAAGEDVYVPLTKTHFSMRRRGGEVFQRRWQIGLHGEEINVEQMKVDYVMGSGNHARSYLSRTAAGTLIELPLGWFRSGEASGYWDMSPGSDTDHPLTRRFVSYKCMFCHNGIPGIPAQNTAPGADPVFSGDMPEGIDCQRCHGPGAAHIKAVSTPGAKREQIRASIVNPARLSPALAMDVCTQCHLETTSTRIPATLVRFDRGPFSFRPGEPFGNFAISFDHAPGTGHDDKFETVNSVYRMRQSKCFTESAGRLLCQTCHNPHRVPRGEEAVRHYSSVCIQCHDQRQGGIAPIAQLTSSGKHPAGSDCVSCHMPKRRADDIPRLVMTDHFSRRNPPQTLAKLTSPPRELYLGEVVPYDPSPLPKTDENALYVAVAQVGLGNNVQRGLPQLAREVARVRPRNTEFYMILGDTQQSVGEFREAIAAYDEALRLQPKFARALRAKATTLQASGKLLTAEAAMKQALEAAPNDPETWYRYGLLDGASGRLPQAAEKIAKAIAMDPTLPEKSRARADLRLKSGDAEGARTALNDALRIDPYDEAAWDLSGRLYSQNGETAEAMFAFERAVALKPGSAPYLYDYALALARANRFDEAEQRAKEALQADSKLATGHELLGGLYERRSVWPSAIAEYGKAIELQPSLTRVRLRLAGILVQQGDRAGALEQLRAAAKDPDPAMAAQALKLLQQLTGQ
ncbi:MAG: Tetratricopeptide 2 repeat protein [Bryobacterales bacterium]|nr:Tetratricopeptide 2 repeat protein [Bryobacterales bacterium]